VSTQDKPDTAAPSETLGEATRVGDENPPAGEHNTRTDSWRVRSAGEELDLGEHADELIGQLVAGRYLIRGLLGRGGMGAVYRAQHTELQKQVALKVLHRFMTTNQEVVARFEREAVAAGRLAHPGIVAATDFGLIEDGSFYLALEFIDGRSLSETLKSEGVLAPERALRIAFQINDALCAAHAAGVVHRDLKPDNVLLVRTDEESDIVKVVDFGIAKVSLDEDQREGITRAGLVFGTPEYMSPEQAMGKATDARSDLYGVGMLLYEMLAGASPFLAEEVTEMLRAQIQNAPPPLPEHLPERLRETVLWLLAKDPEARPQSAEALASEFLGIAEDLGYAPLVPRIGSRLDPSRKPSTPGSESERCGPSASSHVQPARFSLLPKQISTKSVPLWIPVGALAVGALAGVLVMWTHIEAQPPGDAKEGSSLIDAEAQLIVEATGGDRDAISELRKLTIRKQKELDELTTGRQHAEWGAKQANRYVVLGRGYSMIKHHSAAIEMYREALRLDPHLSEEPELLLDVREAISARDAVDEGLELAKNALGAHGADIIYDVYLDHVGQAGMTPVVARAMKIAQSPELLAVATPALQVALRLQQAKLCGEYRDIIPEAVQHADDRSLQKLKALESQRGCGPDASNDCFVCLRKDDVDLAGAIKRAEATASPTFLRLTDGDSGLEEVAEE
jgi:eukaryotic-like serine/threonine-protein kinase